MDEYSELLPLVDFVPVNDIQAMVEKVEHWVSSDVARKERNNEIRKGCADMPDMFPIISEIVFGTILSLMMIFIRLWDTSFSLIQI